MESTTRKPAATMEAATHHSEVRGSHTSVRRAPEPSRRMRDVSWMSEGRTVVSGDIGTGA